MQLNAKVAAKGCWTILLPDSTNAMLFRRVFPMPETWFDSDPAVFSIACTTAKFKGEKNETKKKSKINNWVKLNCTLINYECHGIYKPISCRIPRGIDHCVFYRKAYEPAFPVVDRSYFGRQKYIQF